MKVLKNGKKVEMEYNQVCSELGIIPQINFVKVTNAGTIGFTVGKPDEIEYLYIEVIRNGYKPTKKFELRMKNM